MGGMQTPFQPQQSPDPSAAGAPLRSGVEGGGGVESAGLMKALSPGVVDYLFRQLVAGRPAEDVQWQQEGIALRSEERRVGKECRL